MATQNPNILFQVIDDSAEGNIQGTLDVYNPKKFPLALTFSIKDVMDMTSSKGSFSKSFKIPATSNNNEVLKFLISDSFYDSFEYVDGKKARIFVDGNLILEGAFQVKGHGVDEVPEYYECLVFGDNFKWVNAIDRLNLCDIDFDAGNFYPNHPQLLIYGRQQIMDTWEYTMSGELIGGVGTHVVYPLVNTGKWTYGNFVHPDDMAPAIFILDMVKVILGAQGYTLQSDFMNTDWFKKLISVTPKQDWENDDAILDLYQFEYEQPDGWTDWKTPMNFRTEDGHESDFMGAFRDLAVVCPTCDPSSLVTPTTWYDNYLELMGAGHPDFQWYYSGWYWGAYGWHSNPFSGTNNTTLMGKAPGDPFHNICNESNPWEPLQYHGSNWNCIWLDCAPIPMTGSPGTATNLPLSGYSQPFENCDRFQTNFFGKYIFNGSCRVEMDNNHVINNEPEDFDPMYEYGTHNWSGFNYNHCGGMISTIEYRYQWTDYRCQLWLMHYDEAADKVHTHVLDQDEYSEFCTVDHPLSPTSNLIFDVSFSGVEIDILNAGDYVYYYVEVNEIGYEDYFDGFAGAVEPTSVCQCKYRMSRGTMNGGITEAIVDGGSVSISNLLPCDVTQLEWLNGLTGMFNLYWQSDETTKTIYVEPRDMFFEGADTAVDWTDKLDWGEKQTARYVYDALKRNLCFTYENDGQDAFVEERNRRKGQICELGSEVMDLGELFVNEEEKIGSNYYAPTYMFRDHVIATNKPPFIPVIHSEYTQIWSATTNSDYPDKIEEHKARILLWGGKTPLDHSDGFTNTNQWRWGKMNPSATPELLNYYPFAGVYCDEDETYFGSLTVNSILYYPQLYYQDVDANMVQPTPINWPVCHGLYEVFWARNINNLISRPKIKSAKFHLTAADISALKFQKLIYIENSESATYWIINKVVDFKPAQSQMTKVELFEWSLAKPRRKSSIKKRGGQEYGPDKDSGIGQVGSNKRRLDVNFAGELGIAATNTGARLNSHTTPNLVQTSPIKTLTNKQEEIKAADPNNLRWKLQNTSGALTTTRVTNKSFNIGTNNVKQNSGKITIGQNNKGTNNSDIIIGKDNQIVSTNQNVIEFHVGKKNPALVISQKGEVLEGGGGVVYFEDASGNIVELMTKTDFMGEVNYKKVLKSR